MTATVGVNPNPPTNRQAASGTGSVRDDPVRRGLADRVPAVERAGLGRRRDGLVLMPVGLWCGCGCCGSSSLSRHHRPVRCAAGLAASPIHRGEPSAGTGASPSRRARRRRPRRSTRTCTHRRGSHESGSPTQ
jgi:hypothetical protein